jgi:hypothetical protein
MTTTITGLPNATTPLTGTERVPMDQGANTVDATTQNIANLAPPTNLTYDPTTRVLSSSTGTDVTLPEATMLAAGLLSAANQAKLDSITVDRATLTVAPVRNNTGSAIAKGVPVCVTGSSGTTKTIAPADASLEATAANTLGLTLEAIPANSDGFVVTEGPLTGVNTSGLTEGGLVFLSETTGQLTSTRPTQPAHGVVLGWCVKASAGTSGILYVKVDNGQELNELHDVLISSAVTGPQVLWRSSLTTSWGNRTLTAGDVGADATGTAAAAITAHLAAADHTSVTLGATVADVLGLTGQQLTADDPGESADRLLFWDHSANRLRYLALGANLTITDTTIAAAGATGPGGYPAFSAPTGFSVGGSGTASITLSFATGYSLPTTASQASWDAAAGLAATAIQPTDSRLTDAREWSAATVTQAAAQAGTETTRRAWTVERVWQAAAAWWQSISGATGRSLAGAASPAAGRTVLELGTAATTDTGTTAGNVVALDGSARLPAVDGSQLTNLPGGSGGASSAVRIDSTSTANTIYVGTAPAGSGEAAAVWSITRTQFSAAGVQTGSSTITAVTWTGRTTHTYP